MGTRHLICVYYKGKFVVAQYGQWDGYPSGQGYHIVKFLLVPGNLARLKEGLQYTIPFEFGEPGLREKLEQYQDHPALSRDTGAKILEVIASATAETPVPLVLEMEFLTDGVFCEYAYVVDLDAEVLEMYSGQFEKRVQRLGDGRLAIRVGETEEVQVALVKAFPFGDLKNPDQFVWEAEKAERKGEDGGYGEENEDATRAIADGGADADGEEEVEDEDKTITIKMEETSVGEGGQ